MKGKNVDLFRRVRSPFMDTALYPFDMSTFCNGYPRDRSLSGSIPAGFVLPGNTRDRTVEMENKHLRVIT